MARNIEIKARIESVTALTERVAPLATQGPTEIAQDDTFFDCSSGRLKLRALSNTQGELIFYRRSDALAYGEAGHVRKRRTLFLIGRTRVHLDIVESLGHFLELEVVLREGETAEPSQLIDRAYVDLLSGALA